LESQNPPAWRNFGSHLGSRFDATRYNWRMMAKEL
jgi:hypothetical protein